MLSLFKKTVKALTPPIFWDSLKKLLRKRLNWRGTYTTWETAERNSRGYASDLILEKVAAATHKVVQGEYAFERDSVLFQEHNYNWSLLTCLLHVAAQKGRLRVIDFGGSLGSTFWQNRVFWKGISVKWIVLEQPHFIKRGQAEFENDDLKFQNDLDLALASPPNVILFSSVLSYLPDPFPVIRRVIESGIENIIIDLTAVAKEERITIQEVPPSIYSGSYPCRLFSRDSLLPLLVEKYNLIAEWKCVMQPAESDFEYLGFYFSKKAGEK